MPEHGDAFPNDPLVPRSDPLERLADAIAEARQELRDLDVAPREMNAFYYVAGLSSLQVVTEGLLDALDRVELPLAPARPPLGEQSLQDDALHQDLTGRSR